MTLFEHDRNWRQAEFASFCELADHMRAIDPDNPRNAQEWRCYEAAKATENQREAAFVARHGKPSRACY